MEPETVDKPTARQRILAAARSQFADRGFHAATINEIAEQSQVNRALIFYYFESKESLYHETVRQAQQDCVERTRQALEEESDPVGQLRRIVAIYFEMFDQHSDVLRIIMREAMGINEGRILSLAEIAQETLGPIKDLLSRGMKSGVFRPMDVDLAAISLMGIVQMLFCRSRASGEPLIDGSLLEHTLGMYLHGIAGNSE